MKSFRQFFDGFFDIRRQEAGRVLLMSAYLLLIIACYSATKAVRDSLFVTRIGPAQLPYVYLLIAGAMGLVSLIYSRAVRRIGLHRLIRTTSLLAVSNLLLFWMISRRDSAASFYVLYVWVSLFGAITASQFWLLATHVFNPREARRLFAWLGVGGILGGILGGALTYRLAHWLGTESLLIVCSGMMAATIVILEQVRVGAEGKGGRPHARDAGANEGRPRVPGWTLLDEVKQSKHLSMMVVLLSITVVVEAFIDFEYKSIARQSIASKDQLTAFFGSITFYIGLFALLFQMTVTSRILKRWGVGWAILMLPLALLGAFVAVSVEPALWTAALLQLVDGGFSYSIHRSGTELLYLPIPPRTRNAVKGFIDTFVDRAGRAAGAVLLLVFTGVLALSISSLSLFAAGLVLVWIAMAVVVRREYMHSFRQALEKTTIEPEAPRLRDLDAATMKTLLAQLSSDEERQVLYALDLLSNTRPSRWRPHLDRLIRHPSSAVRARTVGVLASWSDPAVAREEFINHPDFDTARVATASALRLHWSGSAVNRELLDRLMRDSTPAVVREAMMTAGAVGHTDAVPWLIEQLGDRSLRRNAGQALSALGDAAVPELVRHLADPEQNPLVRKRIPKTLALAGRQAAADALLTQLHSLDYHLDYAVLKALNRLRVRSPDIHVNSGLVNAAIRREREEYERLRAAAIWLGANRLIDDAFTLLMRAIDERLDERLERIFRLVGLIYPPRDIYSIYYSSQLKPALRPAAIEFLDNILDAELRETVVPLFEERLDPERPARARHTVEFISIGGALAMLVAGNDPWLKTIAVEVGGRLEKSDEGKRRVITR